MAMDLSWLEDFQALLETRNFSRAAERRHVTQPAFSRRIGALEDWIGTPLFDRGAQPIALTTAGARFAPACADLLARLERAREDARDAARLSAGTLRFAATNALSFSFFPGWLHGIYGDAAPPTVHLTSDTMQACEDMMLRGQTQFLLCHHHPAARSLLQEKGLPSIEVGNDRLCFVAAPELADAARPPILAYSMQSGLGRIVQAAAPAQARSDQPSFTSHMAAALRSMTLQGRGAAWLPASLVAGDLGAGRLRRVLPASADLEAQIWLFRQEAPLTTAAQSFWNRLGPN